MLPDETEAPRLKTWDDYHYGNKVISLDLKQDANGVLDLGLALSQ